MAGYYDQLMQASGGTVPPSESNPWAWQAWAATQDPGTYGWRGTGASVADLGASRTMWDQQPHLREMLVRAGVWNSEWDSQIGNPEYEGVMGTGEGDNGRAPTRQIDLSSLAGYQLADARSVGHAKLRGIIGPDGMPLDGSFSGYDGAVMRQPSLNSSDYGNMVRAFGPVLGAWGAGLGAGAVEAGAASATAPGATTFPISAGGAGWGGGALGAEGLAASVASLNAMSLPAVPTLTGAAAGTGIAAGTAGAGAGINGYLTTGAVEGSTLGSSLTGAGGSAGAVGSGSSASWLQQLGSGISSFFGGSGTGGNLRSAFDIVSGIYGLNLARDARKASDPFGPYRGAYGAELAQLEANPTTITSRPGWKAGMEAIQRNNAARGYAGSGNEMAVMSRYGGEFFNNEVNRLASLAGAGAAPGAGSYDAARLANLGVSSIGYGLAPYIGGARGPK